MAAGIWTPLALPANATGTLEYLLGPDGLVRLRGVVTHVGASFTAVMVPIPAEINPLIFPVYFDWTGAASDINATVNVNTLALGASNFGSPGKTWTAADIHTLTWVAATPTPSALIHGLLYQRMTGDAALVALLATFQGTAAIFTAPPIPENATLPAVVVEAAESEDADDTKTTLGRSQSRALTVYTDATGDVGAVDAIARRLVALFHRAPLAGGWKATAAGPYHHATDGSLYARRVMLDIRW